ncbi:hypothetical protein [Burkholderia cepacia]|uniref:hypothetical protein n=1 Tax=Burkholderia cepacia TaxID=292 RepID=UPI001CF4C1B5|nr:hypothetical protein [Burkholderia cepacia]MCA8349935.1 hypothetical protein [Burkholderia cepacia]
MAISHFASAAAHDRTVPIRLGTSEIRAFMTYLANHPNERRNMLVSCGFELADILEDEVGETPAALAESCSETIVEVCPDLVRAWLTQNTDDTLG